MESGTTLKLAGAAVAAGAILLFLREPPGPSPAESPAETVPSEPQVPLIPLDVGNKWTYRRVVQDESGRVLSEDEVVEYVLRKERKGFRIVREAQGKQEWSGVLVPTRDGIELFEYAMARKPVLFLPRELSMDVRWEMDEGRRATVVSEEVLDLGREELTSFEILQERYFGEGEAHEPGWYVAGRIWIARGIGVMRRDDTGAEVPEGGPAHMQGDPEARLDRNTIWELVSFQPAARGER